jgi:serine/threonine protein kinase
MINEDEAEREYKKNNNKISDDKQLIHKKKKFFSNYNNNNSLEIKKIFREIRTLYTIKNKSNYLLQSKEIKLIKDNLNIIIDFIYVDEGIDLYSLISATNYDYRTQKNLIKWILFQCLKAIETFHSLNIIHRDINPNNILISSKGEIKISEFANSINDIESKFVVDKVVGDLAYIAPECLLLHNYNNKIDIWAIGVLMIELYTKKTHVLMSEKDDENDSCHKRFFNQLQHLSNIFQIPFNYNFTQYKNKKDELIAWLSNNAKFEKEQFAKICNYIPDLDKDALDLLRRLLAFNPKERVTAKEALKMDYFKEYQFFNKEEYKKNKEKKNDNLSLFIKNLEKEFQKTEQLPSDIRIQKYKEEINNFFSGQKY